MASFAESVEQIVRLHEQLQAKCDQLTAENANLHAELDSLRNKSQQSACVNSTKHAEKHLEEITPSRSDKGHVSFKTSSVSVDLQRKIAICRDSETKDSLQGMHDVFESISKGTKHVEKHGEEIMPSRSADDRVSSKTSSDSVGLPRNWAISRNSLTEDSLQGTQDIVESISKESIDTAIGFKHGRTLAEMKSRDLKQMFRHCCTYDNPDPHSSTSTRVLSPFMIAELCQKHASILREPQEVLGKTMVDAAAGFSGSIGRLQQALSLSPHGSSSGPDGMNFVLFKALLTTTEEDLQGKVDKSDWDRLLVVRRVLLQEGVSGVVSEATRVDRHDLFHFLVDSDSAPLVVIESVISIAILANAIIMGVSTDIDPNWTGWVYIELCFTAIFMAEMCLKIALRSNTEGDCRSGIQRHFFGRGGSMNIIDFIIVVCGILDCIDTLTSTHRSFLGNVSIARLVRLTRLARLFKVLRFRIFRNLLLLLQGAVLGVHILIWALILLLFVVYCFGLVLRQTIGEYYHAKDCVADSTCRSQSEWLLNDEAETLFSTVPRSMWTVFRCVTGDCTASDGTPLPVSLANAHGYLFVIPYILCMVFVNFGLFNLIMAIFVENTLENAKYDDSRRRELKHSEHVRTARMLENLMWKFIMAQDQAEGKRFSYRNPTSEFLEHRLRVKVSLATFERVIADKEVQRMMDDLDIPLNSRRKLFDTLDADCNGLLSIQELANGIVKLRGPADKSDIISVLLITQRMQDILHGIELKMHQMSDVFRANMCCAPQGSQSSIRTSETGSTLRPCKPHARFSQELEVTIQEVDNQSGEGSDNQSSQPAPCLRYEL